jgi:hypothetical protein
VSLIWVLAAYRGFQNQQLEVLAQELEFQGLNLDHIQQDRWLHLNLEGLHR